MKYLIVSLIFLELFISACTGGGKPEEEDAELVSVDDVATQLPSAKPTDTPEPATEPTVEPTSTSTDSKRTQEATNQPVEAASATPLPTSLPTPTEITRPVDDKQVNEKILDVSLLDVTVIEEAVEVDYIPMPPDSISRHKSDSSEEGPGISYGMSVFDAGSGDLWFTGVNGISTLEDAENWVYQPTLEGDLALISLDVSSDGDLLGAGCAGLYKFDGTDWQIFKISDPVVEDSHSIPWCATKMAQAADGSIWLNSMDIPQNNGHGAVLIKEDGMEWYATESSTLFDSNTVTGIPWEDGIVSEIIALDDGTVLFATYDGAFFYDEGSWSKIPEDVYGDYSWMTAAALGPDGDIWFGTPTHFARFDGEVWTSYHLADGMPIDIFAISFDSDGQTWLSALEGIGRFDGQTLHYYTYGDSNPFNDISNPELIGMSIAGIVDSMAFSPDGALWMSAGPLGLIRFEEPS
jgi:hypothetical protein